MSLVQMLNWWQWAILAAIPPAIILLYFLKLKRHPLVVPSTYLWTRTIEDLHVNSIWQRLRQSLLLFLQLLLLALIIIALLRPGWRGTRLTGERFIFMIDTSASMSATDVEPTRFENARRQMIEMIGQLESGDVAMIISFSDTPRIEQEYTDSRRALRLAAGDIRPTNRSSDLREALRAAAGLANPGYTRLEDNQVVDEGKAATMYIFSDGGLMSVDDFAVGNLEPIHIKIGSPRPANIGIAAFSAQRNPEKPDRLQAFARLENHGDEDRQVSMELILDGVMIDASATSIPAQGTAGARFELPDIDSGTLVLRVDAQDHLDLDNVAYAAINRTRPANVLLVTPGNEALELALQTDEALKLAQITIAAPDYLEGAEYSQKDLAGTYDLVIFDRCAPKTMPQASTMFIGQPPPVDEWECGERSGAPLVIDVDRLHPLMQLVVFDDVLFVTGFSVKPPAGGTVLVDSVIGGILAISSRAGYEDLVLGIEVQPYRRNEQGVEEPNTNWPIRRSFPTFFINVLAYLGGGGEATASMNIRPGEPAFIRTRTPVDKIYVESPDGTRTELERDSQKMFAYVNTAQFGAYTIREGRQADPAQMFTVNLFDSQESNLTPQSLEIGHEKVKAQESAEPARRELWKWIMLAALGVVLFEWYVYNRRVYL